MPSLWKDERLTAMCIQEEAAKQAAAEDEKKVKYMFLRVDSGPVTRPLPVGFLKKAAVCQPCKNAWKSGRPGRGLKACTKLQKQGGKRCWWPLPLGGA